MSRQIVLKVTNIGDTTSPLAALAKRKEIERVCKEDSIIYDGIFIEVNTQVGYVWQENKPLEFETPELA
ncbi:MAG: hypothetical protein GY861_05620 [bacterium]|nr:hypothetical protein [bacterium]